MTNCPPNATFHQVSSLKIDGVTVQLIFAAEVNREVPAVVWDMLKKSYLQQHSV